VTFGKSTMRETWCVGCRKCN